MASFSTEIEQMKNIPWVITGEFCFLKKWNKEIG